MIAEKLTAKKLRQMAPVMRKEPKSVRQTIADSKSSYSYGGDYELLEKCARDWENLRYMRENHQRITRYVEGDQWGDLIPDPECPGKYIREDVHISRSGKTPLSNNIMQSFMRNIYGQRLTNPSQPMVYAVSTDDTELSEMLTNTVRANLELNDIRTIEISMLTSLCYDGIGVTKLRFDYWNEKDKSDGKVEYINPNRFFFNQDSESPTFDDITRIGEIHDMSMNELIRNFARTKDDEKALRSIYCEWDSYLLTLNDARQTLHYMDFLGTNAPGKCRVIEIWEKRGRWVIYAHDYLTGTETHYAEDAQSYLDRVNDERLELARREGIPEDEVPLIYTERTFEDYWYVKYLTPNHVCLMEMESPYDHQSHPYALAATPRIDGRSKPILSDIMDMQRQINRLLTLQDFILSASAKGVLVLTEDMIPEGYNALEKIKGEYTKANGVIVIKKTATGSLPAELVSKGTSAGAWEMLNFYMTQINQVGGLSGALQGQVANNNTPASLYAQQAQNSMLNFVILFDRLNQWSQKNAEKLLKTLMQYYTTKRLINVNGKTYSEIAEYYEPEMAQKLRDFNLVVSNSTDTPVFRQAADKMLFDLLEAGQIPLEMFLDNVSSLPFSKKLLNDIRSMKEQGMNGEGINPEMLAQIQQEIGKNANPQATQLLQRAIMGNPS